MCLYLGHNYNYTFLLIFLSNDKNKVDHSTNQNKK